MVVRKIRERILTEFVVYQYNEKVTQVITLIKHLLLSPKLQQIK